MSYNEEPRHENSYSFEAPDGYPQTPENGSWQPAYHNSQPSCPQPPQEPPKKKKRSGAAGIVALCLVCAIVGGITGGAAMSHFSAANQPAVTAATGTRTPSQTAGGISSSTTPVISGAELSATQIFEQNVESCVSIEGTVTSALYGRQVSGKVSGSGFIYSSDGYIITNYHVIEGADKGSIKVILHDGTSYTAAVTGYESDNDIAVLKIDAKNLTPVTLGNSADLKVGNSIYAIGDPLGEFNYSMTDGIVSGLDREISTDTATNISVFQINAAVNSGNSGGPVFNGYGQVVGIVNAKYNDTEVEGIGFAIPIDDVKSLIADILNYGYVKGKPYIGITVGNVSGGVIISSVTADSPASKAGLKVNDIVVKVNDKAVSTVDEFVAAKKTCAVGDSMKLTIYRAGKYVDITVVLGETPRS